MERARHWAACASNDLPALMLIRRVIILRLYAALESGFFYVPDPRGRSLGFVDWWVFCYARKQFRNSSADFICHHLPHHEFCHWAASIDLRLIKA
jgi:hypothetical protein